MSILALCNQSRTNRSCGADHGYLPILVRSLPVPTRRVLHAVRGLKFVPSGASWNDCGRPKYNRCVINAMEFRNRPMVTRVLELCDACQKLQPEVKDREQSNYYPRWYVQLKSCSECFEAAKREAANEARGSVYGYC